MVPNNYTSEQYLKEARHAIDTFQPAMAAQFLERAFTLEPSHDTALLISNCHLDLIQTETESNTHDIQTLKAKEWLSKCLELKNNCFEAYLSLGQVNHGDESLECYEKAVDILRLLVVDGTVEIRRFLSNALCAMTEIYMTDCCEYEEAESQCITYMNEALSIDPANSEVYSTQASVFLSQSRDEEACEVLETGMNVWYKGNAFLDQSWPVYQSRMGYARLFIEVGNFERALQVLETCESESEDDGEVWYLFGWTYLRMVETGKDEDGADCEDADEYRQDARECLERVLEVILHLMLVK